MISTIVWIYSLSHAVVPPSALETIEVDKCELIGGKTPQLSEGHREKGMGGNRRFAFRSYKLIPKPSTGKVNKAG